MSQSQSFIVVFMPRKWMITVSAANKTSWAANSLLNNNCVFISATAFTYNQYAQFIWSPPDIKTFVKLLSRRNKERNSKTNCIWKREFPYKHIQTKLLFTFAFAITLQVFWDIATELHILHIVRGRSKIIWINSIKSVFCVGIRVFQISMTTPS